MRVGHRENKRRLHAGPRGAWPRRGRMACGPLSRASTPRMRSGAASHPLNEMVGVEAIAATVWEPLLAAMPDLERRDLIVAGGTYQDRDYVAAVGHHCGTFVGDWLGIPATGRAGLPALRRGA